ncbi:MAG: FAD-dependent monooxygenase [Pseudomonadota bacterium]
MAASKATNDIPVLIVGAGPTGLTAALKLAKHRVPVRLVEKRTTPSPLSRAVGLLPRSMAIFESLGVAEQIRHEALEVEAIEVYRGDRPIGHIRMSSHPDPTVRILCLPQDRTESILAEALSTHGVTAEYGTTFEGLEQAATVSATVSGERRRYAAVLGCDGSRSTVRSAIGLLADGYDLEEEWSIADLYIPDWSDYRFRISIMDSGEMTLIVPMQPGRYRLVTTEPDALLANPIPLPDYTVRRTGSFKISVRQVPEYGVGRVWLAGDAAHTHSPVGGRGMNLGIADANDWADRYVADTLEGYSGARHAVGARTIQFTEQMRKLLQESSPLKRAALMLLVRSVSLARFMHPRIAEQIVAGEF